MNERHDRGLAYWWRAAVALSSAIIAVAAIAYAAGVPAFLMAPAFAMFLLSFLMRSLTSRRRPRRPTLTPRRVIAMFGVIPIVAGGIGTAMFLAGFRGKAALWAFGGLVLLCDLVYVIWFDRKESPGSGLGSDAVDSKTRQDTT